MSSSNRWGLKEDHIRQRSYLLWEREGCPDGRELDFWLRAERELRAEMRRSPYPIERNPGMVTVAVLPGICSRAAEYRRVTSANKSGEVRRA